MRNTRRPFGSDVSRTLSFISVTGAIVGGSVRKDSSGARVAGAYRNGATSRCEEHAPSAHASATMSAALTG